MIVVSPSGTGIRQARAKTDRLDARALAKLLWASQLDGVWLPDERVRAMRRRLGRRTQLVRARTRAKNDVHAVLLRCLEGRPPASDLFGVKGRRWLAGLEFPVVEQETVDAALRQVEFLDTEIAAVEQLIAAEALSWPEVKRLMTVPGVNVVVAATVMAAIGDIARFPDRRKLTGYLGLDPRARGATSMSSTSSLLTISTFSCDIAYSRSPASRRASSRSKHARYLTSFPLRNLKTRAIGWVPSAPLCAPRTRQRPRATTVVPASRISSIS